MLSFPILFPRSHRNRGRRRPPPAPPPAQVTVLSVTLVPEQENALDFEFSAAVTTDGGGSEAVVVTDTNIGPAPALFSYQQAANIVRFEWEGVVLFDAGMHWTITALPACLDFLGNPFPLPQGGNLVG